MDHSGLETKLRLIRSVQREAIERLMPRVQYLETRQHFVDAKDQTLRSVKVKGYKRPQTLRQSDGIHFTVPGSRYFANRIAPKVLEALGIKEDGP